MFKRFLVLVAVLIVFDLSCGQSGEWPRPESLVGFWPLNADLRDIANGNDLEPDLPQFTTGLGGDPFNVNGTFCTVSDDENAFIGHKNLLGLPSKFTISFYFFTGANGNGGILMFWPHILAEPRFSITYSRLYSVLSYLQVWGGPKNEESIGKFAILRPGQWNFLAITYDKSTSAINVYNENGEVLGNGQADVPTDASATLDVGYSYYGADHLFMSKRDGMRCLMFYKTVLTPEEIRELPEICKKSDTTPVPKTTTPRPTTISSSTTPVPIPITPWPQPGSLLGLWPLTFQYAWRDVSQNGFNPSTIARQQFSWGPFGDEKSAVVSEGGNSMLFEVKHSKLSLESSFTVSMFLKRGQGNTAPGGIFEFVDSFGTKKAFQFRYENGTTIEVSANGQSIGHYTIVQQKGAWTFVAFVYDGSDEKMTLIVYGRHGVVSPAKFQAHLSASNSFNNNGIRLGYASRWDQGLQPGDALSCLSVYSSPLNALEIGQLYDACRTIHGSAPCGSPKVALSPIPSAITITTMGKPGQFPYIASIRYDSLHVCSASIIDPYWVVTASSCFLESKNPSLYKVYVGKHDLNVAESQTREHNCVKITLSGSTDRDIALMELDEPIDFTNLYVNDACMFTNESISEIAMDRTQFVFGWGINGRPPLVSSSLPRYTPGLWMTDQQCMKAWQGVDYTPVRDFCFMSASNDKDVPCLKDEGSPLLAQVIGDPKTGKSDRLMQIGTYYKRDGNCSPSKPALFANVAMYSKWITETIACAVPGVSYPPKCPQN